MKIFAYTEACTAAQYYHRYCTAFYIPMYLTYRHFLPSSKAYFWTHACTHTTTTTTTTMRSSSSMHAGIEGLCMHACVLLYGPYVYFLPSSKAYFLDALLLGKNGYIVVVVCMHACMCTTVWSMHAVKV